VHGGVWAVLRVSIKCMESCLKIGREYQHWLGALLYKMGKSVLYREAQHKIQSQHTTTNMSHCRPTLQRLWPSLSMATSAMDPNLGAAAPHGPIQGSRRRLCSRHCWFLRSGCRNATPQKQREGWGLDLRWPQFEHTTQQPTKSLRSRWGGYSGGRAIWTERVGLTLYHRLGW